MTRQHDSGNEAPRDPRGASAVHGARRSEPLCRCGAEEVYYEGYALDPTDLGPVVGYGCEAQGRPYLGTLDRLGFHVAPQAAFNSMDDALYDSLTDAEFQRLSRWRSGAQ